MYGKRVILLHVVQYKEKTQKGSEYFSSVPEGSSRLASSVKMADCIRVPLLLLLICILSFVHLIRGENGIVARLAAEPDKPQNPAGGAGRAAGKAAVPEKNVGVAASLPRRRFTGWKLAEEAVCREDVSRLCPRHSWTNNLSVLECLQDRKEVNYRGGGPWWRLECRVCRCWATASR